MNKTTLTHKLTIAVAAVTLAACTAGNGPTPQTDDEISLALGEEYGALTEADEEPDFADDDIANEEDLNDNSEVVDDATADAAEADLPMPTDPSTGEPIAPRRGKILIAWGKLRGNPFAPDIEPLEWNPTISVLNAGLKVKRLLGFEAGDSVVLPRDSITSVDFVSTTGPHIDGVLLEVVLHPALGTSIDTPPVLMVESGPFTGVLPLRPDMPTANFVPVDESGNGIAYHLVPDVPRLPDCRNGFVAGRYIKVGETEDGRPYGRLKGKLLNEDGEVVGKMRGVWGRRATNNAPVLFAKLISNEGNFRGIMAGHYGPEGHFRARVIAKNRIRTGVVHGVYRAADAVDGGHFRGRFSERCGELRDEGSPETHDEDDTGTEALDDVELDGAE